MFDYRYKENSLAGILKFVFDDRYKETHQFDTDNLVYGQGIGKALARSLQGIHKAFARYMSTKNKC